MKSLNGLILSTEKEIEIRLVALDGVLVAVVSGVSVTRIEQNPKLAKLIRQAISELIKQNKAVGIDA